MRKRFCLTLAICLVALPIGVAIAGALVTASQSAAANLPQEPELLLLGTVVLPDPGDPIAIIQVGDPGEQALYRLGDVVEGGRLISILTDSVTLAFADIEVHLRLNAGTGGSPAVPPAMVAQVLQPPLSQTQQGFWLVEPDNVKALSSDLELDTQVTSLGADGLQVARVRTGDLLYTLGLQPGDIIRSINGNEAASGRSLQQAITKPARGETLMRLEIERQGRLDVLYYQLDP
jgi:type II secretory pathway component PulC